MTSMRYRDMAARGHSEYERRQVATRRLTRIVAARRRLPELQTAAVPNDIRPIVDRPSASRRRRPLQWLRALGRSRPQPGH